MTRRPACRCAHAGYGSPGPGRGITSSARRNCDWYHLHGQPVTRKPPRSRSRLSLGERIDTPMHRALSTRTLDKTHPNFAQSNCSIATRRLIKWSSVITIYTNNICAEDYLDTKTSSLERSDNTNRANDPGSYDRAANIGWRAHRNKVNCASGEFADTNSWHSRRSNRPGHRKHSSDLQHDRQQHN